jgi:NADPH2:quinone reductase
MSMWNIPADDLVRIHAGLMAGLETGVLSPVIAAELPLAEAARAHAMVLAPGAKGKIVLIP